jgi:hypothetical protein
LLKITDIKITIKNLTRFFKVSIKISFLEVMGDT